MKFHYKLSIMFPIPSTMLILKRKKKNLLYKTLIIISVVVIVVHVRIVHLLHVLSYPTRNIVIWLLDQMKRKIVCPGKLFSYFFPPSLSLCLSVCLSVCLFLLLYSSFSCWCSSHKDSGISEKESLLHIRRLTSWKWPDKTFYSGSLSLPHLSGSAVAIAGFSHQQFLFSLDPRLLRWEFGGPIAAS